MLLSGFHFGSPSISVGGTFSALPILVGVVSGIGADVRLYRTIFVEEIHSLTMSHRPVPRAAGKARVTLLAHVAQRLDPDLTNIVITIHSVDRRAAARIFFGIPARLPDGRRPSRATDFSTLRNDGLSWCLAVYCRPDFDALAMHSPIRVYVSVEGALGLSVAVKSAGRPAADRQWLAGTRRLARC